MEPYVARAFLNKLLNEKQRSDLKEYEKTLPPMRYLVGSELCRRYHLKPEPLPEAEIEEMTHVFHVWEKRWESLYEEAEKESGGKPPVVFETIVE